MSLTGTWIGGCVSLQVWLLALCFHGGNVGQALLTTNASSERKRELGFLCALLKRVWLC